MKKNKYIRFNPATNETRKKELKEKKKTKESKYIQETINK